MTNLLEETVKALNAVHAFACLGVTEQRETITKLAEILGVKP